MIDGFQANLWREQAGRQLQEKIKALEDERNKLKQRLQQSEGEVSVLKKHMNEMGGGVVRLAEKEREAYEKS